ncbi:DUF2769 domain-containing protein [Methanoregula sp.]|uniref:DUF2769 domain-containing protein n=1 Tax=Methanoregula sp. TaxID=2052170 RepID=UPI003C720D8C
MVNSCKCPTCNTYSDRAKTAGENMYCGHGSSFQDISTVKGCNCITCDIGKNAGATHHAFCIGGSENAQRYGDGHR